MDPYGKALLAYLEGDKKAKIKVDSDIAETEYWPVSEFFHSWADMSQIERTALQQCKGRTLDVGAGSGSHVLWLQQNGISADALDVSEGAVAVMQKRGLKNVIHSDFYQFSGSRYDTILMLMNGAGIIGTINNLPRFFAQVKQLLLPGGQLIMDSSDIIYLFQDDDGSVLLNLNGSYYGELEYTMSYKREKGEPFKWLFIDFDTLQVAANQAGMKCEKLIEDDHYQYLVRATI